MKEGFFKFKWSKLIIFILIVFLIGFSLFKSGLTIMCDNPEGCRNSLSENIFGIIFFGLAFPFAGFDIFENPILIIAYMILAIIIEILYFYTISCLIVYLINKVRK